MQNKWHTDDTRKKVYIGSAYLTNIKVNGKVPTTGKM